MSIRIRLVWAFLGVVFAALLLSLIGLNAAMYMSMMGFGHGGMMMDHGQMMGQAGWMGSILRWSLGSSLVALIVAGATGYVMATRITKPLFQLREAAHQLDLRDLTRRVPVEGNDEISDLALAFNRMGDRLEAEERARRQLLADVAHELRHPLAIIQGRLDLLQEGDEPITPEDLLPLEDQTSRMTRLVGDLRDLSLAEVGRLSLHRTRLDPGALVSGVVADMEPVAAGKGIAMLPEIGPDLPLVNADPDRLRQVVVNLVVNALQYTTSGGRITVAVWREASQLMLRVSDTGSGIAKEDLPHVFDRFYRGDKSRSRASGGSGLGLAIVRSLVELHGGSVRVTSEVGEGTAFTITLP